MSRAPDRARVEELLDGESLAVLAILLAVSLEFGFGFAKTVAWWAGLLAGPAALATLIALFRVPRTHALLAAARPTPRDGRADGAATPPGATRPVS